MNSNIIEYIKSNKGACTIINIARQFHISQERVHDIIKKEGLKSFILKEPRSLKGTVMDRKEKVHHDLSLSRLKDSKKEVDSSYKVAIRKIADLEREKEAMYAIKTGARSFEIKPQKGLKSEATALWLASDWHVAERVTLGQTNGINQYTLKIAEQRATAFFRNGLRLTNLAAKEIEVKQIVLALLGDFITGHLHLDAVEKNQLAPVEETLFAQRLIIAGIEYILKHSDYKLVIPCHSGNHGRTTKFAHFGSENGHSLEFFMYQSIAGYFRNEPRVTVIISEGSHSYLDIYGYKIRFLHGHDVKYGGGVGGLTIPLNKAIAQWDRARPAYLTCLGHFHQKFDGGSFLVNGSLIGYNSFALSIKASAERPQQMFALIDKVRGKTLVAPILLDE